MFQEFPQTEPRGKPRLLLVDGNPSVLPVVWPHLQHDFEFLGQVWTGTQAREKILSTAPDVVLVDLTLVEDRDGLELIRWIALEHPTISCLATPPATSLELLRESLAAGARGCIPKPYAPVELAHSIQSQMEWNRFGRASTSVMARPSKRDLAQELWTIWPSQARTGQTTMAISLATTLAEAGQKVLLVELDSGGSRIGQRLDLPRVHPTMREVLESLDLIRPSLALETLRRAPSGFSILPLMAAGSKPPEVAKVLPLLLAFSDLVDHLLIDIPFADRDLWTPVVELSRRILVTGSGSAGGLDRVRDLLSYFQDLGLEQRLVPVQTMGSETDSEGAFLELLRNLPVVVSTALPYRPEQAAEALSQGVPLSKISPQDYGLRLRQLTVPLLPSRDARKLVRELSQPPRRPVDSNPGFIQRLFSRPPRRSTAA